MGMYEFRQRVGAGRSSAGASSTASSDSAATTTTSTTDEKRFSSPHDARGRSNHRDTNEEEDDDDDGSSTELALVHPLLKRGASGGSSHAALASSPRTKKQFELTTDHRGSLERASSTSSSLSHFKTVHESTASENVTVPAVGVGGTQTHFLAPAPVSVNDLDADLRQLAILQTLLQRQQAIVQASVEAAAAAKKLKRELEEEENAAAGASRTVTTEGEDSSSTIHGAQHQQQHRALQPSSHPPRGPSSSSTSWLDGLNTIHDSTPSSSSVAELAQAQQQLDLWTKVAFTSHAGTPLPTNNNGGASPNRAPSIALFQIHRSPTNGGQGDQEEDQEMNSEDRDGHPMAHDFDWSSFYPDLMMDSPGRTNATTSTMATSTTVAPFVVGGVVNPSSSIAAVLDGRVGPTTTSTPSSLSSTESKPPQAPRTTTTTSSSTNSTTTTTNKSLSRRASTSSRQRTRSPSPPLVDPSLIDELLQDEYPLRPPLTEGTPEEIEQDKRRRNTEASARFRARKKQRDAVLLHTSAQLRARAQALEKEKMGLVKENQWLRELAQAAGAGVEVGVGGVRKRV
ncbi:BQ2448_5975 [Microbotryum intermedium]|uniref:BQ2448_5975 protein n=1 Tax=Microbotryum intermedium TaxID=269621 RepID=A0A238F3M0_9BASI|nr:BQ2448_5975 [Microbotryum intermedium]